MKYWKLITWASATLVIACSSSPPATKPVATIAATVDPWVLEWTDPTNDMPAYLANGLSGVRIGRDGTRMQDGEPTQAFGKKHTTEFGVEWFIKGVKLNPTLGSDNRQRTD